MNKRIKKKIRQRRIYTGTAKQRKRNKALCERYPFLIPRNVWTGKLVWGKDFKRYSYTLANEFPRGWWKAFGLMLCEQLREDLLKYNFLKRYRISDIKEKYGSLRLYDFGIPQGSEAWDIIHKYEVLSEHICISCGKPDVPMINDGWYSPWCRECFTRGYRDFQKGSKDPDDLYNECICSKSKMPDEYTITRYSRTDKDYQKITFDISKTAQAIREKWSKNNNKPNGLFLS